MNHFTQKYPQNIWSIKINKMLSGKKFDLVVDAPCGNGIISYLSAKQFPNIQFLAVDIDEKQLSSNFLKNKPLNLNSRLDDIFQLKINNGNNAWLFVNSLYCLPEKERLMENFSIQFNSIFAVFPDIESSNYKYFTKKNKDFENPSAMTILDTIQFFEKYGFKLIRKQAVTSIPFHIWNSFFDKIRLNIKLKNLIFTLTDSIFFFGRKQYEIMEFKRYE
ncbi:MAG TPA: class I SAM-dependent methyltransferase [Bacteroidia bacterium]